MLLTGEWIMRYLKTTNTYKASNFSMNMDTMEAYSYGWWLFTARDRKGRIIFNNTYYSNSTCKHQNKALKLLDYKVNLTLSHTRKSLVNLEDALIDEIKGIENQMEILTVQIHKKGSRKSKNLERLAQIEKLNDHMKNVIDFLCSMS